MGEDCGSWFPQQRFDWQSPNLDYFPLPLGQRNTIPPLMNPGTDMFSKNGSLPMNPFTGLPGPRVGHLNESCGWFYRMPCFQQSFTPAINSVLNQKLPNAVDENCKGTSTPKVEPGCAQKRFLVFDQSGDQTTLIFSSGIGAPVQCFTPWTPKPTGACVLDRQDPRTEEDANLPSKPVLAQEFGEQNETELQSEMHEDTDELNALLYSDDDSDYTDDDDDDDEVTSTGHSPRIMTAYNKQNCFEGSMEEVASSDGSSRKRKMLGGGWSDVPSLIDAASSMKPVRSAAKCEDDAESKCAGGMYLASNNIGLDWGNKRMRKERIHETVSVLQNIIPGGKSKDPVVFLDEAIQYLKCLKQKAEASGFDSP